MWKASACVCTVRDTYLFVKLHEGGLEQLLAVGVPVVYELGVRQTLVLLVLGRQEVLLDGAGQLVERNRDVLGVSHLLKLVVRHSLVRDVRGVVGRHVAGQFREIGGHRGDRKMQVILYCKVGTYINNRFNSNP